MSELYDRLNSDPEVENMHPIFLAVVEGTKCVVATDIDGYTELTEEGKKFLDGRTKPVAKPRAKGKTPGADDALDNIDLGD